VPDPDDDRAARWSVAAGDEALARLAWEEAAEHFRRALAAADILAAPVGSLLRGEAHLGLGGALLRSGEADEAALAFAAAADLADALGDPTLLGRAALGFAGLVGFEVPMLDRRQVDLLERALDALPDAHSLRPLVLARLSVALSFLDTPDRRLALAEAAVTAARAGGDPVGLVAALAAHCDAVAGPAHVERRLAESTEIVATASGIADRRLELLGRRLRYVALLELGRFAEADAEASAFARAADELGDPLYSWYVPLWEGCRALAHGRVDEAVALADEVATIGARASSGNAEVLSSVLRAGLGQETHDRDLLLEATAYLEGNPHLVGPNLALATGGMWADVGDADRAAAALGSARFDDLPVDAEWLESAVLYLAAATELDRPDLAAAVEACLPFEELFAFDGIGAHLLGSAGRWCGPVLARLGRLDDAIAVAARAVARDATGGPLIGAHARRDLARVLLAAGRVDESAVEARAALDVYRSLGLDAVADRWASALGVAAPARRGGPTMTASLVREGDTWAVTFGERTVRVRHAKGVADLAVLLARPGTDVHVRELDTGAPPGGRVDDPRLDASAIEAYKARVRELEAELDEADGFGDAARSERLRAERDFIVDELAAALGLGGRSRQQAGDPDERMRKAVSARVKDCIRRFEEHQERLGRALRLSV
jgi:tetratricopeptide (TPR) repeat protein